MFTNKQLGRFAFCCSLALSVALSFVTVSFGVNADVTGWVGVNNSPAPPNVNNYSVTGASGVGGTFAERQLVAASLSDQTLTGGPFNHSSVLSMSGTVTFSGAFDPVWFFGWYNSANLNERVGIGMANPVPAGTGVRWQTQSGNTGSTGVVSQDFVPNANVNQQRIDSTVAPGTYDFTFMYDGLGHMDYTFGTIDNTRNYASPISDPDGLNLDRFGILQKSGSDDNVNTFTLNITNINYTGQTDVGGAGTPGDYNNNGTVDAADYVVWRNAGANDTLPNDPTSGTVDSTDYDTWKANFGRPSGAGSGSGLAAVPEPASAALVLMSLCVFVAAGTRFRGEK